MTTAPTLDRQLNVYLRDDAIDRLTRPIGVTLNRKQLSDLLGMTYGTVQRLTARGGPAGGQAIADILNAAQIIADRWGIKALRFDDLFEVRPAA